MINCFTRKRCVIFVNIHAYGSAKYLVHWDNFASFFGVMCTFDDNAEHTSVSGALENGVLRRCRAAHQLRDVKYVCDAAGAERQRRCRPILRHQKKILLQTALSRVAPAPSSRPPSAINGHRYSLANSGHHHRHCPATSGLRANV